MKRPVELPANSKRHTRLDWVCTIAIAVATMAAFLPILTNQFVNWDDPYTLSDNKQLGSPGILAWAFTTRAMGHFQPLAWLTWSAVKSTAGLAPSAFHTLSLIGHLVNAMLVFLVTRRLTRSASLNGASLNGASLDRASASVAAAATALVFAVHPLRVEPVAWASAFPYVESLLWLLVATLMYLRYTDSGAGKSLWFGMSVVSYVLSLLSRVAAVGYPVVLLILDVFPLRRVGPVIANETDRALPRVTWTVALLEKLPFAFAAVVCAFLEAGSRETVPLKEIGMGARFTTTVQAPILYLIRMLVPVPRSPIDPLPISPTFKPAVLTLVLTGFAALTLAAWRARRHWPAVTAAWFAYLVLLAPVMGLTPSGQTETADRYMYLPGVALSMILGLAIARLRQGSDEQAHIPSKSGGRPLSLAIIAGVTVLLGTLTWQGVHWWHDSTTLWTRALAFDGRNDIATYNLAVALQAEGRRDEAIGRYEQTLSLIPNHAPARRALINLRTNRGFALAQEGQFDAAASDLRFALDAVPDDLRVTEMLSFSLARTNRDGEAAVVLREAIARHPDNDELAHNLARILATSTDATVRNGALALRLALAVRERTGGRDPRVLDTLAAAYAGAGQLAAARRTAADAQTLARQLGDPVLAAEIAAHPWSASTRTDDAKR
jgi:tetratricopeptide (TPR) repeat protein